jgi:hypothetical protein
MSEAKRLTPKQVEQLVRKKWNAHHATWLTQAAQDSWPLSYKLHELTEKDAFSSPGSTRDWVQSWRAWTPRGCALEWASRRWGSGDQELPQRLVVPNAEAAADLLGVTPAWERAKAKYAQWSEEFPRLSGSRVVARYCDDVLVGYSDADFTRLTRLLHWFVAHPTSGLYLRQLPVADVDTKWVEKRTGAVGDLVRQLLQVPDTASFHEASGLRTEPSRMRIRILCPELRAQVGGLCDIEAPAAELAAMPLRPRTCLVVENKNTGIALPDMAGTVVFMRLGLAVDQLEAIGWIAAARKHLYWGDLDTYGFAALARARRRFPSTRSVLMDEETLLAHSTMWVREDKPSRVEAPDGLTPEEQAVYEGLRTNRWGEQVRLEQERIAWPMAIHVLRSMLGEAIH